MSKESTMTEWLKLERLAKNDLPLPRYETPSSAGMDFAACLTRPCKLIPPGKTHKEAEQFVCCEPTLQGAYTLYHGGSGGRAATFIKRFPVGGEDEAWQDIKQTDKPTLIVGPQETIMIPIGFKAEFGSSYVLNLHVRSSAGLSGLMLANGTGIIDPDYRGELFVVVYNRNKLEPLFIDHGQRIAQGVMLQFKQAIINETAVDNTTRGDGGFGSTGDAASQCCDEVEIEIKLASETASCPPHG